MSEKFNEKLQELSFTEDPTKFPSEDDIKLSEDIHSEEEKDIAEKNSGGLTEEELKEKELEEKELEEKEQSSKQHGIKKEKDLETEDNEIENFEDADVFKVFASELKSDLFPEVSEERLNSVQSVDDIKNIIQEQLNSTITDFKESYKQSLIDNLKKEGIINDTSSKSNNPFFYNEEDIKDNIDKQKSVITTYYKEKGVADKMIDSIISSTIDLESDAMEALKDLKTMASERATLQEKKNQDQIKTFEDELKVSITKNKKYIPGFEISDTAEETILQSIPTVLEKINSNLTEYAPKLAMLAAAGILDGDFKKIVSTIENESNSKFKDLLLKNKKEVKYNNRNAKIKPTLEIDNSDVHNWY